MWVFLLVVLTYCLTVGFTTRYKEAAIEAKELRLKDKASFEQEIGVLLLEVSDLKEALEHRYR